MGAVRRAYPLTYPLIPPLVPTEVEGLPAPIELLLTDEDFEALQDGGEMAAVDAA